MRTALGLALFTLVILPIGAFARSSGTKVSRIPDTITVENSQTMTLLAAHHNADLGVIPHAQLAIVDGTAIASEGPAAPLYADAGLSGTGQISVYTVREGDTLSSIAKMFGVSTNTILWSNVINGGKVAPGDQLVILPVSGVKHIVKTGDTLQSIAKKYSADVADILAYNELTAGATLAPGDVVIVPDGEVSAVIKAPVKVGVKTIRTGTASYGDSGAMGDYEPLLVDVSNYPSFPGYFSRPLSGGVKTQGLHGYNAVDIGASIGTPIMSAAEGTVIISKSGGYNGGYGTYVVISHSNGTQTLYGHMSKDYVTVGQKVIQGQIIGAIGSTGKSTGAHLHFEIRGAKNPF
jgi:LysM repeat protein